MSRALWHKAIRTKRIEADYSSAKIKKDTIASWPGYYGDLYLMLNELHYVSTKDNFHSVRNFSFEQWGGSDEPRNGSWTRVIVRF